MTPSLFQRHPRFGWVADATRMGVSADDLASLPWRTAFDEMTALEGGAIANPDEKRAVGHYWLRKPILAPTIREAEAIGETVEAVRSFAERVRSGEVRSEEGSRFTHLLHIGIGGSALGPALVVDALGDDRLSVHFLDNTDPDGIARILRRIDLRECLVAVVTKSGGTAETRNAALLVREAMEGSGIGFAGRTVAVTVPGSDLDAQAVREEWLARFAMWPWVGGRTSVTSSVGLLPTALAGIDIRAFLSGAAEMDDWTRTPDWRENPAALLAGCWYRVGRGRGDRNMVVIPYADRLRLLAPYLQQLVMESLGKESDRAGRRVHQGITVYGNKGSTDQHAYVQQLRDGRDDFFATFVQVLSGDGSALEVEDGVDAGDYLQGFLLGTRRALYDRQRPSLTLTVPWVSAQSLGALIALFERAVGLYAALVDVNAYHQPGVEAGKRAAKEVLALSRRLREAVGVEPMSAEQLAVVLSAETEEVYYLAERLVLTGRLARSEAGYLRNDSAAHNG